MSADKLFDQKVRQNEDLIKQLDAYIAYKELISKMITYVAKEYFYMLATPEQVEEQIEVRRNVMKEMVGGLYRGMVSDELDLLYNHPNRFKSAYERLGSNDPYDDPWAKRLDNLPHPVQTQRRKVNKS